MTIKCQQYNLLQLCPLWEIKIPKPITVLSRFTVFENQLLFLNIPAVNVSLSNFKSHFKPLRLITRYVSLCSTYVNQGSTNFPKSSSYLQILGAKSVKGKIPTLRTNNSWHSYEPHSMLVLCSLHVNWYTFFIGKAETVKTFLQTVGVTLDNLAVR
jgi:hypothetical protein